MRIAATVPEIRALLQLAELDARAEELPLETYQSRRDASRKRVARTLLERYQTLFDAGRSPVIAAIERASCSGCHLRLPTMVESLARRSPAVHTCPHCGRMLYVPALLAEEESRRAGRPKKAATQRAARVSAGEGS
jgi:predicted  nucleic acid-binding Zn-ribbon protein